MFRDEYTKRFQVEPRIWDRFAPPAARRLYIRSQIYLVLGLWFWTMTVHRPRPRPQIPTSGKESSRGRCRSARRPGLRDAAERGSARAHLAFPFLALTLVVLGLLASPSVALR